MPASKDRGLALIEKGYAGPESNVPSEHCFEVGIMLAGITDEHGVKILKWQKLSARLLEKLVADAEGMPILKSTWGSRR